MIGGGVLGSGCVQEEIRFIISPELICSLLFTAEMKDNECIIVKGSERYCNYSGYSSSFDFNGPYHDNSSIDVENNCLNSFVVAIDALQFVYKRENQYSRKAIKRELDKAFCGFAKSVFDKEGEELIPIATGNWGCGVFGGFFDLKVLIQLMAAAHAGRSVKYFTFKEPGLSSAIKDIHQYLIQHKLTVSQVYKSLLVFCKVIQNKKIVNSEENIEYITRFKKFVKSNTSPDLFGFIKEYFSVSNSTSTTSSDDTPASFPHSSLGVESHDTASPNSSASLNSNLNGAIEDIISQDTSQDISQDITSFDSVDDVPIKSNEPNGLKGKHE